MQFKANLFLTILAIGVLAFLVSLGNWQLGRAQEKQALLDLQAKRMNLENIALDDVDMVGGNLRYLPVKTSGQLDVKHQLLIDNQVRHGQVGYTVLTPLRLADGRAILLNRGWVPLGENRENLPDVSLETSAQSFIGKLDWFPSVGIKLEGADELTSGWPAVTQVISLSKVAERLGYDVLPYQMRLNSNEPNGYDREWVPMKMGPEKHHGYAFQWFALAVAWVALYFVLTIKVRLEK